MSPGARTRVCVHRAACTPLAPISFWQRSHKLLLVFLLFGVSASGPHPHDERAEAGLGADVSAHLEALREACGQLCDTTVAVRRFFCDDGDPAAGSNACIQDLVLEHLGWEPMRKQTNCHGLWTAPCVVASRPASVPSPARIPDAMLSSFSYKGRVQIAYGNFSAPAARARATHGGGGGLGGWGWGRRA